MRREARPTKEVKICYSNGEKVVFRMKIYIILLYPRMLLRNSCEVKEKKLSFLQCDFILKRETFRTNAHRGHSFFDSTLREHRVDLYAHNFCMHTLHRKQKCLPNDRRACK